MPVILSLICLLLPISLTAMSAADEPWHVYIDADWSHSFNSSQAIEWGLKTALYRHDNIVAGRPVTIIRTDHRGNSRRSTKNLQDFLADPNGLAVFCGMHSPPVLANLNLIQQQGVLLLDPWAAAGTHYPCR